MLSKKKGVYYHWYKVRCCKITALLLCLLMSPFFSDLYGDLLFLKDGQEMEGFFIREYQNKLLFQDIKGKRHIITSSQVERLEIGFAGTTACYRFKDEPEEEKCNVLFVRMEEEDVVLAKGKGFRETTKIEIEDLKEVELSYDKKLPSAQIPPLQKGYKARVETKQSAFTGRVVNFSKNNISLKDKRGILRKYSIGRIKKLLLRFGEDDLPVSKKNAGKSSDEGKGGWSWWQNIPPGWRQYERGEPWKAAFMGLGSLALIAGLIAENSEAEKVVADTDETRERDAATIQEARDEFGQHQTNQVIMGLGLLALYSWHIIDVIVSDPPVPSAGISPQTKSLGLRLRFLPQRQPNHSGLQFGFRFDKSF